MKATRRTFLGGLAAAATPAGLISDPAAASAKQRADYHYAELVKALDEAASDYDGWDLRAIKRKPVAGRDGVDQKLISVVRFDVVATPLMVFERHHPMG